MGEAGKKLRCKKEKSLPHNPTGLVPKLAHFVHCCVSIAPATFASFDLLIPDHQQNSLSEKLKH